MAHRSNIYMQYRLYTWRCIYFAAVNLACKRIRGLSISSWTWKAPNLLLVCVIGYIDLLFTCVCICIYIPDLFTYVYIHKAARIKTQEIGKLFRKTMAYQNGSQTELLTYAKTIECVATRKTIWNENTNFLFTVVYLIPGGTRVCVEHRVPHHLFHRRIQVKQPSPQIEGSLWWWRRRPPIMHVSDADGCFCLFVLSRAAIDVLSLSSEGVEQCKEWSSNMTQQIDLAFNIFFMVYFFIRVSGQGEAADENQSSIEWFVIYFNCFLFEVYRG